MRGKRSWSDVAQPEPQAEALGKQERLTDRWKMKLNGAQMERLL